MVSSKATRRPPLTSSLSRVAAPGGQSEGGVLLPLLFVVIGLPSPLQASTAVLGTAALKLLPTSAPSVPVTTTITTVTTSQNVTIVEVGRKWVAVLAAGRPRDEGLWVLRRKHGPDPRLQQSLEPDSGHELGTPGTEAAQDEDGDEESSDPVMGPDFGAAEQPTLTEFQIFPVSSGGAGWGAGDSHQSHPLSSLTADLASNTFAKPSAVEKCQFCPSPVPGSVDRAICLGDFSLSWRRSRK